MELLWIILLLFVGFAEAENVTEVKVQLGQSVSLNCSVNTSDVYWYMEIHSSFRALIGRTYSSDIKYFVSNFNTKYEAGGNVLLIRNITADDCRLYFCGKKQRNNFTLEDSFLLVSGITPSSKSSEANSSYKQPLICRVCQDELIIFSSFALNALLLLAVIGLGFKVVCLRRRSCSQKVNDPSPFTSENPETLEMPQYEEIQLHTRTLPSSAAPPECIYYKAQPPLSRLPQQ